MMRRGSALLIVLGMVSFMVVSAIGFSVYMRESRKPSSFLRRESTARYLLKSALANAIARIDGEVTRNGPYGNWRLEGVYDDVYPGVTRDSLSVQDNGNYWNHRVFTPFGPVGPHETVSTLTLEGLAYLPPAIINEARAFSRMTRTARWCNLSYDLGRYAFCAIDVSDCFDVNKVAAGLRRSSAAGERVNLSSLFPQNGTQLDTLLTKWEEGDGVPFVSMADFNVAAGNTAFTPFYRYIGSSGAKIYTSSDHQAVSNALFITDTWFPATNDYLTADLERKSKAATDTLFDLEKGGADQPFRTWGANSFMGPLEGQTRFLSEVGMPNLGAVGVACLYDYLDEDHVPLSLCLPCVETAPMVCGVGIFPAGQFILHVKPDAEVVTGQHDTGTPVGGGMGGNHMETVTAAKYALEIPAMQIPVKVLGAFPFRRTQMKGITAGSYQAKALIKIFFAPERLDSRLDIDSPICPRQAADWNAGFANGIYTIPCDITLTVPQKDKMKTDDAIFEPTPPGMVTVEAKTLPLFWKVTRQPIAPSGGGAALPTPAPYYSRDGFASENERLVLYRQDGTRDETLDNLPANPNKPALAGGAWPAGPAGLPSNAGVQNGADLCGLEVVPHVAVWVRVEKNGDVVDLVPAGGDDDVLWGKRDGIAAEAAKASGFCGAPDARPVLEFSGVSAKKFKVGENAATVLDGTPDEFQWNQLYATDPRYNFAPEDWFAVLGGGDLKEAWKQSVTEGFLGKDGRDKDVFMFTSDQQYLQSIGELQFLPFVQVTDGRAAGLEGTYKQKVNYNGRTMADRVVAAGTSPDSIPNGGLGAKDLMWRTYCAYDRGAGWNRDWCNPYDLVNKAGKNVEVISGTGDFRVNPFSRDSRIMSSVVADTPYDYFIASTNSLNPKSEMSASAARQMAFGENGQCEQWDAQDIAEIAQEIHDAFGNAYDKDGVTDFAEVLGDYLDWETNGEKNDEQLKFLANDLELADPLYGIDRKFLCAYWRECFQNRQQLFLVFVRAEPLTVGGSSGDAIANAQLGARGVALVWRDPAPPPVTSGQRKNRSALQSRSTWREQCKQTGPHRTRVLFYHQFD